MESISEWSIVLKSRRITLRPPEERDWEYLVRWNDDLEYRYFDGGDEAAAYILEHLQRMYDTGATGGYHFVVELNGTPVGGCWLHEMDLARIKQQFPNLDCRRMGLFISAREPTQPGVETQVVNLLTQFAFEEQDTEIVFCCNVDEQDPEYRRALESNSYITFGRNEEPSAEGYRASYDYLLMRETYDDARIA